MRGPRALVLYSAGVILLALPCAYAQSGGKPGGGTGSGGSSTKTIPSTGARQVPPLQQERRPLFVSGRVMLDDGTLPPDRASIERVCNGQARREAYSDSHGQFSFQMGAEVQVFQDASMGTSFDMPRKTAFGGSNSPPPGMPSGMGNQGVTPQELMSCELRATLPGFHSDSISLAGRQIFDHPDVGTIVLHRMGKAEGTRISVTSLQAPRDAKKAFERGRNLVKEDNIAAAANEFSKATELYPKYAEALAQLGEIYAEQGRQEEATKLFQQAIDADAQFLPPYFDLALLAARKQDWKGMAEFSDRALALDPYEYPAAYFFHAVANYNLHQFDAAEKSARTARRLDSQHHLPRIDFLLANILLQRNDYAGAAEQLQSFLKYQPSGAEAELARELLARAETKQAAGPTPAAMALPK